MKESRKQIAKMRQVAENFKKFEERTKKGELISEVSKEMHSIPYFLPKDEIVMFQIMVWDSIMANLHRFHPLTSLELEECFLKCELSLPNLSAWNVWFIFFRIGIHRIGASLLILRHREYSVYKNFFCFTPQNAAKEQNLIKHAMFSLVHLTRPRKRNRVLLNDEILECFIRIFDTIFQRAIISKYESMMHQRGKRGLFESASNLEDIIRFAENIIFFILTKRVGKGAKYYRILWKLIWKGLTVFLGNEGMECDEIRIPTFVYALYAMEKRFPEMGIWKFCKNGKKRFGNLKNHLSQFDGYVTSVSKWVRQKKRCKTLGNRKNRKLFARGDLLWDFAKNSKCRGMGGVWKWWKVYENVIALKECHNEKCKRKDVKLRICRRCKAVYYCKKKCQKIDWGRHKKDCFVLCDNFEKGMDA